MERYLYMILNCGIRNIFITEIENTTDGIVINFTHAHAYENIKEIKIPLNFRVTII